MECAKDLVRWTMKLCSRLSREDCYFRFEHPKTATSWKMTEVQTVSGLSGVEIVRTDMCEFWMQSKIKEGVGPVMMPTSTMTNSPSVVD